MNVAWFFLTIKFQTFHGTVSLLLVLHCLHRIRAVPTDTTRCSDVSETALWHFLNPRRLVARFDQLPRTPEDASSFTATLATLTTMPTRGSSLANVSWADLLHFGHRQRAAISRVYRLGNLGNDDVAMALALGQYPSYWYCLLGGVPHDTCRIMSSLKRQCHVSDYASTFRSYRASMT